MLEISLGILSILLLSYIFLQRRQNKKLGEELETILKEEPTNRVFGN